MADAVARVTHDAICEGSNVDTVTVNGQTYGAVPMRSLYSVGCDTEEVDEVLIWVDTPTFSNEATVSEISLVPEQADQSARVRELEYECAQLREQLEAHRGAAENLCMPVSSDRGAVPCWSDGETGNEPHRGWHYVLGGPYTSYTLPEAAEDGLLFWWRFDQDEGCWAESECLGARILSDDIHMSGTCEETEAKLQRFLEAAPKP